MRRSINPPAMLAAIMTIMIGSVNTLIPLSTILLTNWAPRSMTCEPHSLMSWTSPTIACPKSTPGKGMGSGLLVNSKISIGLIVNVLNSSRILISGMSSYDFCRLAATDRNFSIFVIDFLLLKDFVSSN